jgi:hypothetical protein
VKTFYVSRAFEVPIIKKTKKYRVVDKSKLENFWGDANEYVSYIGCYVFSLKASRGELPYYVGRTTKQGFGKECFASHKINGHYTDILNIYKGTPYLRFVYLEAGRGPIPSWVIDDLEFHLIANAAVRNRKLSNKTGRNGDDWVIDGIDKGKGRPTIAAKELKKIIGL